METLMQLNSYNDLEELSDIDLEIDHNSEDEVKYIGKIPGYYYINLIEYKGDLYLMITRNYKKIFYFRCVFDQSAYESIAREFGFIPNGNNEFFTRPETFNEEQEKKFIGKLLELNYDNNFMANKYGLK